MKFILLLLLSGVLGSTNVHNEIREAFRKANQSQENAHHFNALAKDSKESNENLKTAYLGGSQAILAKFENSLSSKLSTFKEGIANIETAIEAEPNNIEIRLIRLVIQHNAPGILNYNKEKEEDKSVISTHFSSAPKEVQTFVLEVVKETEMMSAEEINNLE